MENSVTFYLPIGLEVEGKIYKSGKMHLTTTLDELNVQANEDTELNPRYRDILLLTSVIDEIGDLTDITKETIMNLYEADFLYLQLLYNHINGDSKQISTSCSYCGTEFQINLPELYSDFSRIK